MQTGAGEQVFLIAHVDSGGHNAAQATVVALTEDKAKEQFNEEHPEREILTTGVKGVG